MSKDDPDQAKILALFDRLTQTPPHRHRQCGSKIADQLAVLLAIRFFNRDNQCATCENLAAHLQLSIDRTIAATNALAINGYVEAFTTSIDIAGNARSAIAFRLPGDDRALHFLEREA
jgi:hypothetical protein